MTQPTSATLRWSDYIERFHDDRPGITEALLADAIDEGGDDPYGWVRAVLPERGPIIDVACGSGPVHAPERGWIGIDRSSAELDLARLAGRCPLVAATAEALPLADRTVGAVVVAMALMVVDGPTGLLAEAHRVLRPDGVLVVLLPADRPLTTADRVRYAAVLAVLGRASVPFPNREVIDDPAPVLGAAGFEVVCDERRRFAVAVGDREAARRFVESLYLPRVGPLRIRAARAVTVVAGRTRLGVPLRRVVARPMGTEDLEHGTTSSGL